MTPEQKEAVRPTSKKLASPRSGSARLTRIEGDIVPKELGNIIAAWETPEQGAPKRVVVRCDGQIVGKEAGFPMAVLSVQYSIGGLQKKVLIDAVSQSALTLWCNSVEVIPVWDDRRIERTGLTPCVQQILAAAINSDQTDGDTGAADARWLDAIKVDETTTDDDVTTEWSIHPIPEGARGVRFLDTLVSGAMFSVPGATTFIVWSADTFDNFPTGLVQCNTNGATDTSVLIAPACARFLFLGFPDSTIETFDEPSFIEWIMAPNTLPGF